MRRIQIRRTTQQQDINELFSVHVISVRVEFVFVHVCAKERERERERERVDVVIER